jgi:hypothetical protein
MFCGECGRAVGARAAESRHPDSGMPVPQPLQRAAQGGARDTVILEPLASIPEHEHPIEDAAAVGEVAPAVEVVPPEEVVPAELPVAVLSAEAESEPDPPTDAEVEQDLPPEVVEEDVAAEAELDVAPEPEQTVAEPAAAEQVVAEPGAAEPGAAEPGAAEQVAAEPATAEAVAPAEPVFPPEPVAPVASGVDIAPAWLPAADPPVVEVPVAPRPDPFPWGDRGSAIFLDSDELEQTLITARRDLGDRFVLQFSTGESVTVFGTGLLGRNPVPQPGEYFDQLVAISDPGKSVSKTHLEFGQEAGAFWVSDRYSGNGSVVREPDAAPRRLVAGRRYRIVRGSRVDIGEQFFVVS